LLRGLGELTLYRWSCCFLLQTLLRGLGELHLEIVVDKLRRQFNVPVETGQAYVAYREGVMSDVSGVKAVYVTPSRRSKEPCPAQPMSASKPVSWFRSLYLLSSLVLQLRQAGGREASLRGPDCEPHARPAPGAQPCAQRDPIGRGQQGE
jgi:hypothetical protein